MSERIVAPVAVYPDIVSKKVDEISTILLVIIKGSIPVIVINNHPKLTIRYPSLF